MIWLLSVIGAAVWAQDDGEASPGPEPAAEDEQAREDDMFGAPAGDPQPAEADPEPAREDDLFRAPASRDDAVLGGFEATTNAAIFDKLDARDATFAMGGQLWLRSDGAWTKGQEALEGALSSPNLLDLFADARPNDRVRTYARARLRYDPTVLEADSDADAEDSTGGEAAMALLAPSTRTSVALDQLWTRFDIARTVYMTIGAQPIRWGSGRFWNPTDFMNQQALDPLAVFDERPGTTLVKAHLPLGSAVNLYALGNLEEADSIEQIGGGLRAESLMGTTELALSAATRRDQPLRLGADVSTGFWLLDLHVEGAVRHGGEAIFWEGELDLASLTLPTEVDRSDDWIPQVVAGAELGLRVGDDDTLYIGAEGLYNDAGYDDSDLYPWLFVQGAAVPFYLGRQYASAYLFLPSPGRWDDHSFTLSAIANLSDETGTVRFDWRGTVLTHLALNAYVQGHGGDEGGELYFGLDEYDLDPPRLEVGLGALVRF